MSIYKKESPEYFDMAMHSIWDDQTLKPNEIVLVEDGELTTELYSIIKKWKDILNDILVIIPLEENVGFAKALNIGLNYCNYELVVRMDTDDIALPERFKIQYEYMNNHPEIVCCGTYIQEFDENDNQHIVELPTSSEEMLKFVELRNPLSHPSVMFRKSIIQKVGGYPEKLRLGQDYGLWSILLARGYKLSNIPKVLLKLRTNSNFFKRRGWESFKYEVLVMNIQYKENLINEVKYIYIFILRFLLRMSPLFLKKLAYKVLRRTKNV